MVYRLYMVVVITRLSRPSSQSKKAKVDKQLLPVKMFTITNASIDFLLFILYIND